MPVQVIPCESDRDEHHRDSEPSGDSEVDLRSGGEGLCELTHADADEEADHAPEDQRQQDEDCREVRYRHDRLRLCRFERFFGSLPSETEGSCALGIDRAEERPRLLTY